MYHFLIEFPTRFRSRSVTTSCISSCNISDVLLLTLNYASVLDQLPSVLVLDRLSNKNNYASCINCDDGSIGITIALDHNFFTILPPSHHQHYIYHPSDSATLQLHRLHRNFRIRIKFRHPSLSGVTMVVPTATVDAPPHSTCSEHNRKLSKKGSISRSRSSSSSSSHRRCTFTRKCARLVKEQRARFYIMRRCVSMLVCWHDYGDS
ncbi:hypothetical protein L2E82_22426 [Cichorium intybus]|uniref:Uncharacterized protein n=1 Tax=Cichorium intybus TaxID=13427 RepID=A0ACB9DXC0_CICIN|nr:hypothetical protein L2E82_22426 [Cichorium intybus]